MFGIRAAIENTVPISLFNKGQAGKIFSEVRSRGPKVVVKNNVPECVLLSPEEYIKLLDAVEDAHLRNLAEERMAHFDPSTLVSQDEVDKKFGFTPEDLAHTEEIEFE